MQGIKDELESIGAKTGINRKLNPEIDTSGVSCPGAMVGKERVEVRAVTPVGSSSNTAVTLNAVCQSAWFWKRG